MQAHVTRANYTLAIIMCYFQLLLLPLLSLSKGFSVHNNNLIYSNHQTPNASFCPWRTISFRRDPRDRHITVLFKYQQSTPRRGPLNSSVLRLPPSHLHKEPRSPAMSQHPAPRDSDEWPLNPRRESIVSTSTVDSASTSILFSSESSSPGGTSRKQSWQLYEEAVRLELNPSVTMYVHPRRRPK